MPAGCRHKAPRCCFLAEPITFGSMSQIAVIRTSFKRSESLDMVHAPAVDADHGDPQDVVGTGGLGIGGRILVLTSRS